ncbi:MAG TPA: ADP-forming succinate--CoA ligase subunit beta [Patescibacteria group bacterium]|nr:ADP-forming succinate--CoA ligase subunit beta [Patescibacteria group bacterium]
MKLLEYQAKQIFAKYGIPTPKSKLAESPNEAQDAAREMGTPVVIKAQLLVGGRGKAGGIVFADDPADAFKVASGLLGKKIKDIEVRKALVEEKLDIKDEIYLGIIVDRQRGTYVVLASAEGGVDIEEVARVAPEKIIRFPVDPLLGLKTYHGLRIARQLGYSGSEMQALASLITKLYRVAVETDAELTEINPLAVTDKGFIAADARLNVDNNALFRHRDLVEASEDRGGEFSEREMEAKEKGLTYVELDGNIGVIGNGAGLTMATIDTVTLKGGRPANFLDLGGGATPERIEKAVTFVLSDSRVDALLVNILGGITRCDDTAKGIIQAREHTRTEKPIVVRMMGTNEDEGKQLLAELGIDTLDTMEEAAERAVALARGE